MVSLYHECGRVQPANQGAVLDPFTLPGEDEAISGIWCPVLAQEGCGKPERILGIMTYGERLRKLSWFSLEKGS